ncbi:NYN domain-containing protein [Demequina flava]|uniref:NYN domain-containing protein n=1 Tax=Demequina flava TaxID=1095025 RepID=UPI000780E958|nr:NYN domain-containing protein [Demequina flava]
MSNDIDTTAPARRLILIDVENLLGCEPAAAEPGLFAIAVESLLESLHYDLRRDLIVVGVGVDAVHRVFGLAVPHRLVMKAGRDGADRALVEVAADHDFIARRFNEVVVASGDHEFIETVVQMKARHVRVTVASRDEGLNCTLAHIADDITYVASARDQLGLALAA